MTKEHRDKREAEKRARMEGAPDLGGVTLPFSRAALLRVSWVFALLFPAWTIWNARGDLSFETVFAGSILFVACLLPSWFWVSGRIQGLPIFPLFGLTLLPTYVTPIWQGHSSFAQYTTEQINTAAWTMTGFLLIALLFWQQMAVRAVGVPQAVRMIDMKKAEKVLLWCLVAEVIFEVGSLLFQQLGGGAFAAVRGFASAAGRMGLFVFSYQMGQGALSGAKKSIFLCLVSLLVIQECTSLLLSTALPTLGVAFAGYILGSGKLPWKSLAITAMLISILHAGKFEMRAIYHGGGKKSGFTDLPAYFLEWIGYGLKNLTTPAKKLEMEDKQKTSVAKERASLIQLMVLIQTMTPSQAPYLQGVSYEFVPALLVPRILNPGKGMAHTGNIILSAHYGILSGENLFKTSVGFDPVMEAYANFGFLGVALAAVIFGFLIGGVTRLTINVPILSFGFLFGVQLIAVLVGSWNTAGVLVTSLWQAFLALVGLSFVLMSKQNNPVWKYYALKLAEKLKIKSNAKVKKTLKEMENVLAKEQKEAVAGNGSLVSGGDPSSISEGLSPVPQRHERPTRYVYGEKNGK